MGWLTGFSYRQPITADTSTLTTTESDIALPVFAPDISGKCEADFDDVQFTGTDGETLLDWYWEDKTAASGVAHIKVASLTHGDSELEIGYMYYGNASATDASDEPGTFSAFLARYALAEASGTIYDSTSGNYDSTAIGGTLVYGETGQVADGVWTKGVGGHITLPDINALEMVDASVGFWARLVGTGDDYDVVTKAAVFGAGEPLLIWRDESASGTGYTGAGNTDTLAVLSYDGATELRLVGTDNLWDDTNWHHIGVTLDATNHTIRLYFDGAANNYATNASWDGIEASADVVKLGYLSHDIGGKLDEIELHTAARTASWWKARYLAGTDGLFTFGAEEEEAGGDTQTITRAIELYASSQSTVARALELSASETQTLTRALALSGADTQTITRALELSGLSSETITQTLELVGSEAVVAARSLALAGADPQTLTRAMELSGLSGEVITRALELVGSEAITITRALALAGAEPQTITRTLELYGLEDQTVARALRLFGVSSEALTRSIALAGSDPQTLTRLLALFATETVALTRAVELWGVEPGAFETVARTLELVGAEAAELSRTLTTYAKESATLARTIALSASQGLTVARSIILWAGAMPFDGIIGSEFLSTLYGAEHFTTRYGAEYLGSGVTL